MLTAPDANNRPLFAAKDIAPFYVNNGPKIFPRKKCGRLVGSVGRTMGMLLGPRYDGKYLRNLIRQSLGETRLHHTLSNVVIPTFDIKRMQPTVFSSFQVKNMGYMDAPLSDICIGTSAAPTYFPAHKFTTADESGNPRDFHLIDGGVAANNPTLVAVREVSREVMRNKQNFFPMEPMDYAKVLVISLGAGVAKREEKYTAEMAAKWGILSWVVHGNSTPIIDVYSESSSDMVDYFLAVVFQALHSEDNYLRIQADNLTGDVASVDVATEKNLNNLVGIGHSLLQAPMSRVDLQTGSFQPVPGGCTNQTALIKFAKMLSDEQKFRKSKSCTTDQNCKLYS